MRAAVITSFGAPDVLEVREVPTPEPGPRQVLVRVHGSALNRADILQRMGRYPPPPGYPTDIGGIEFAGEVSALGSGASRWGVGDRVYGITGGGCHAEFLTVDERAVARIPDRFSFIEAAAIPEAFFTAHDAMVTQAGLQAGEFVMIHAIGSGVGLAASQVAAAMGARVFGTTRTEDKLERARAFGMHAGVAVRSDLAALGDAVREFTGGTGIHVTLDLVGGPYLPASMQVAALLGRIMLIGTIAGAESPLNHRLMLGKRLMLKGTVLRARNLDEKIAVTAAFARDVTPMLEDGRARPVVDRIYPLAEISAAHAAMESNETFGKVVIDMA